MSTLTVVGGAYLERCDIPHWSELYGSGVRAAAALCGREASILLRTCIGSKEVDLLEVCAASFGFETEYSTLSSSIGFHYLHSLAPPTIYVPEPIERTVFVVEGENVLQFGMIEADAVVNGEWVVYDPQSPLKPKHFAGTGSRAQNLALVLNSGEASNLAATNRIYEAGCKLLIQEEAQVVVIKNGPRGATIFTRNSVDEVPAFRTRNSWLLGSGDVFSAVFAYGWIIEKKPPVQAAYNASLATAFYCQSQALPVPSSSIEDGHMRLEPISLATTPARRSICLVGPTSNLMQIWCVQETKRCLVEQGFEVFSAYHDIGPSARRASTQAEIETMQKCDLVFAILDGYDLHTVHKASYARELNKPVIAFAAAYLEDLADKERLEEAGCQIFEDLPSAIYASVWEQHKAT